LSSICAWSSARYSDINVGVIMNVCVVTVSVKGLASAITFSAVRDIDSCACVNRGSAVKLSTLS